MEDHGTPLILKVIKGTVLMKGPGRMEGAFTADAALVSAARLLAAAVRADRWSKSASKKS